MVDIIDPTSYPDWNDHIKELDGCSIFYSSNWAKILKESYGYRPLYFSFFENDKIVGLAPFFEVNSLLTGKRGVALPFTDFCDLIANEEETLNQLLEAFTDYGAKNKWKYYELRGGKAYMNQAVKPSSVLLEHTFTLNGSDDDLFASVKGITRRNINRAVRENVTNKISKSRDSLQEFYKLNCLTRKRHGLPPQPRKFFKNFYEHILAKDQGFLVKSYFRNEVIACGVFMHFGQKSIYKYSASNFAFKKLRANYSFLWEGIKELNRLGSTSVSFGRTEPSNKGLREFKTSWNPKEEEVFYYKYDFKERNFVEILDKVKGPHNLIFRNMPNPLLRLAGDLAYKHMA
ncbi:peptidoglycan bridge formation glycyltransferase FemA/FemB family protein [Fulvivirgaceae bacterium BMA10]|uniref:Peptidoglycan bridge formation glycyltransferase FemA/FemB family protein n=1 Tax=Splendidivirga corallicola TaxID=3051826 RepID=A0ABT8KYJ4_9BACT|nr:peptidoglycan bridge formation glycyltransferase FemA/FemB family protein [Fulvivirgaceae bacterium BMA10]